MPKSRRIIEKATAGIAALGAAAATAYYFYADKKAARHRKEIKDWAAQAKKDIVKEIGQLKTLSKPTYDKIVSAAVKKYGQYKKAAPGEMARMQKELKGYWQKISRRIQQKRASRHGTAAKKTSGGKRASKK